MKRIGKAIAAICLALMLCCPLAGLSEETGGTFGSGLTWTLNESGTLTVSGSGYMYDGDDYGCAPWDEVKEQIREIVIEDGVTHVGAYMFWNCENAVKITLGKDVGSIGKAAFMYTGISTLRLPDGLSEIDDWALVNCHSLSSIYIPASVSELGETVFWGSTNLARIYFGDSEERWDSLIRADSYEEEDPLGGSAGIRYHATLQDYLDGAEVTPGKKPQTNPAEDDPEETEDSGKAGRLRWQLDADGVLIISGYGAMDDYYIQTDIHYDSHGTRYDESYYSYPWLKVSDRIKALRVEEGVTQIGNMAFSDIRGMKTAYLPQSLKNVVYGAFHGTGLTDVYYAGSRDDWMYIGKGQENSPLWNADIHYDYQGETPDEERMPGDADGDGEVNGKDALLILRFILDPETGIDQENADANGDCSVSLTDALLIWQYACGWDVQPE